MKRQSFAILALKGMGFIILGNILCLFMTMALSMFGGNIFTNVISIICGSVIFFLLIFTIAWQDGCLERKLALRKTGYSPNMLRWLFIGLILFLFAAAPTVILLCNKLLFPKEDFLIIYRLVSGSAYPFLMTFVPVNVPDTEAWVETSLNQVDSLPVLFPVLMLVYYAFIPVCTVLGFRMGFYDKLNSDKIMYK